MSVGLGDAGNLEILVPAGLGQSVFWCGGDAYGPWELFIG